jgi:hypothetical protein
VLLAGLGSRLLAHRAPLGARVHGAACYLLGGCAAWWLTERVVDIVGFPVP